MNSSPTSPDPLADENASLWAARIEGSVLSAADRIALDAWLAEKPAHRTLLSQYCQFSADLELHLPALVEAGAVQMPVTTRRPQRSGWRLILAAGSALGIAAAVTLAVWLTRPTTQFKNIATPVAQRQSITLADGTHVDLNARTSLEIEIGRLERHVRLSAGEAFFEVSKDKARPFIVETPFGSVRVTGTRFDVRADAASALEVTVAEGSVQVRPARANGEAHIPELLGAGDQLSSGANGVLKKKLSSAELEAALAWRKGQIVFRDTPLREALARFAHYNGRAISVTPDIANQHIGGIYSLDDPDGFFSALEQIYPVHVTRDVDGSVRVRSRAEP